jgi:hypothetical protein
MEDQRDSESFPRSHHQSVAEQGQEPRLVPLSDVLFLYSLCILATPALHLDLRSALGSCSDLDQRLMCRKVWPPT